MISLLISLLVLIIVIYVVHLIIEMLALPDNIKKVVYLIFGLIVLVALLGQFGMISGYNGVPLLR